MGRGPARRPAGEAQHHDGVLAAGEQQHRTLELADHFAQDVDRLVLQVGKPGSIDLAGQQGRHSTFSLRNRAIRWSTASSTVLSLVSMRSSGWVGSS